MEKNVVFKDADLMLGIAFRHMEDYVNAELVLKKVIEAGRTVGKAMVHLSEIYLETDRNEEATEMYYSGIVKLRDPKTWEDVYEELEILLSPEEREHLIQLPFSEKGELVRRYWKQNDPTPTTKLNERLVEHFHRVKFARINYPDGIPPYFDDRGKIYVKYGTPDAKYLTQMTGANVKENESWSYEQSIQKGLTFDFVKRGTAYRLAQDLSEAAPTGSGTEERNSVAIQLYQQRADFTDSYNMFALQSDQIDHSVMSNFRSERMNAVEKAPVSVTRYEQAEPFLPFIYNMSQFRVAGNKSRVEVYMGVSNNQLKYVPSGEKMSSTLLCSFVLQDSNFADIKREDRQFALQAKSLEEVRDKLFMHQENFELAPGMNTLAIRIDNPQSNAHGSYSNEIEIRDFRGSSLMVSDIQLSTNVQTTRETDGRFVKKGFRIVPYPYTAIRRENPINIYFEVYNLKYNASGRTDYTVTHTVEMLEYKRSVLSKTFGAIGRLFGTKKKAGISASYQQVKTETEVPEYLALDMGKLPPGLSRLVISITDNTSGETASVSKELQLLE
jgi:GWxTD domain-containing protein